MRRRPGSGFVGPILLSFRARVRAGRAATLVAALLCAAALAASGCATENTAAGESFQPRTAGVLTVATAFLPAPGFWEGTPPVDGFEAGLAAAIAKHLGLQRVKVVQVPFADITRGELEGADIALSQLTPTPGRDRVLDFTGPYLAAPPGVLARAGVDASDEKGLRGLRWVISRLSTLTPVVENDVRPIHPPIVVDDRTQALAVLRAGRADALMLDLPVALGLANDHADGFHVLAQLAGEASLAIALPNHSPNRDIVDSAIRALTADGTIGRLVTRWLGSSEDDVPLILTSQ